MYDIIKEDDELQRKIGYAVIQLEEDYTNINKPLKDRKRLMEQVKKGGGTVTLGISQISIDNTYLKKRFQEQIKPLVDEGLGKIEQMTKDISWSYLKENFQDDIVHEIMALQEKIDNILGPLKGLLQPKIEDLVNNNPISIDGRNVKTINGYLGDVFKAQINEILKSNPRLQLEDIEEFVGTLKTLDNWDIETTQLFEFIRQNSLENVQSRYVQKFKEKGLYNGETQTSEEEPER